MALSFTEMEDMIAERRLRVLEAIRDQVEPSARECMFDEIGPVSMAISMKRIADFICGHPGRLDVVEYVASVLAAHRANSR